MSCTLRFDNSKIKNPGPGSYSISEHFRKDETDELKKRPILYPYKPISSSPTRSPSK
jgi:hypothetical protein